MLPKLILVPTDFSANAEQALDYACELAAKLGSTVRLVHAVPMPPSALQVALPEETLEGLVAEHGVVLERLMAPRRASVSFGEAIIEVGDPRDAIVETTRKLGADLIIMGTHGRRGLSRVVMGSVAEDVIRHAPCPVLTVRAKAEA
ncbi:MAG TPA: universal stress protein [Kofleriaceae bacterium]|nr:universal stress protein [Kofleriaceae bacterium]